MDELVSEEIFASIARLEIPMEMRQKILKRAVFLWEQVKSGHYGEKGRYGGCIYAACREANYPITIPEILTSMKIDGFHWSSVERKTKICWRFILKNIGLKLPIMYPEIWIPKLIDQFGMVKEIEELAMKLAKSEDVKRNISGTDPRTSAAATIFIACAILGYHRTQNEMAGDIGVATQTLSQYIRKICSIESFICTCGHAFELHAFRAYKCPCKACRCEKFILDEEGMKKKIEDERKQAKEEAREEWKQVGALRLSCSRDGHNFGREGNYTFPMCVICGTRNPNFHKPIKEPMNLNWLFGEE